MYYFWKWNFYEFVGEVEVLICIESFFDRLYDYLFLGRWGDKVVVCFNFSYYWGNNFGGFCVLGCL